MAKTNSVDRQALVRDYKEGMSLRKLGALHGISHEAVRKLLTSMGLDRLDGGAAILALKNTPVKLSQSKAEGQRREFRSRAYWGMTAAEFDAHVAQYGNRHVASSPMRAYVFHRQNAKRRGLKWGFTFGEWWKVWVDSGKWDQRGRHADEYVMARYGDGDAPYAPDTVYICTASENLKDGFVSLPYNERRVALA